MREMKDTEICWCKNIPSDWSLMRVKDLARLQSGDTFTADDLVEEGLYPVYGGNGLRGYADRYTNDGDHVLIGRQGALCGNINYGTGKFFATEHAIVVYSKKGINVRWLGETLRTANLNRLSMTAAQPGLSVSVINNQFIPCPPEEEQRRIAEYLDSHVSSIDKRVSLLATKRDHYLRLKTAIINRAVTQGLNPDVKMKDSGVEWIGMIPEHWEIRRMKDLSSYISRGSTPDYVDESNFAVMNQATFSKGYIDFDIVRYSSPMKKDSKLQNGDLIMASTGGGILGKVFYFENTQKDFYADTHVTIIRGSNDLYSKFAYYYFTTRYEMINALMAKGSTNQTELQRDALLRHVLPVPSMVEQREITAYLDEKCTKIDAIVENLNQQIEKHKLLKRALINEVITGQRAV